MEEDIRKGIVDLQREKLEQLRAAVRLVRIDEVVEKIRDITDDLVESYGKQEEGMYKLKVLESIRKNYEFMVKVADIPFQLGSVENTGVRAPAVQAITWESDVIDVKN